MPAASRAWTTSAIAAATSAGPNSSASASIRTPSVAPTASAARSCSTESSPPRVSTVTVPPPSPEAATCEAISTAHSSWALVV